MIKTNQIIWSNFDCFPNVKSATYIQEAWTLHVCWTRTLLSLGSKGGWQCCPSGTAKRQNVTSMQRTGKSDQVPSTTLWSDFVVSEGTWSVKMSFLPLLGASQWTSVLRGSVTKGIICVSSFCTTGQFDGEYSPEHMELTLLNPALPPLSRLSGQKNS